MVAEKKLGSKFDTSIDYILQLVDNWREDIIRGLIFRKEKKMILDFDDNVSMTFIW